MEIRNRHKTKAILSEERPRMIGIGGASAHVGCTHLAVMMLNYLTGYRRRKAVLLEWNRSGDFERMELICTGKTRELKRFRVLEGDYCKQAGPEELAAVLQRDYNDILIDYGALEGDALAEFLRCDRQFVVGSFSEWQEQAFRAFIRAHDGVRRGRRGDGSGTAGQEVRGVGIGNGGWEYLAAFGSEETRREFRRRPGVETRRIPFSADAFSVTKECGEFFEALL